MPSRYDPRRFQVTTERLAIYSGVYFRDEVITDFQAGSALERLVELGMIADASWSPDDSFSQPERDRAVLGVPADVV